MNPQGFVQGVATTGWPSTARVSAVVPPRPSRTRVLAPHGFTIVEVCITLMIVAILATVSAPSLTGVLRVYRLNGATRAVWADLHRARLMAVKENRTIRVDFTAAGYTLVRVDTAQVAFTRTLTASYPGVSLTVPTSTVTFGSAGMLSHTTRIVQIQSVAGTKQVTVMATGQIGAPV